MGLPYITPTKGKIMHSILRYVTGMGGAVRFLVVGTIGKGQRPSPVREITNRSSTFSATNISSNIVWLLQLHDTIQTKSNFGTKFSSIYLAKWGQRLVFRLSFFNLQRANIDMCLLYKSHQIARLVSHLFNHFSKLMFTVCHKNATKFGSKNEILHIFFIIKWLLMAIL